MSFEILERINGNEEFNKLGLKYNKRDLIYHLLYEPK